VDNVTNPGTTAASDQTVQYTATDATTNATGPGGQSGAPVKATPEKVLFTPEQQAAVNAAIAAERRETERRVRESDELKQLRQKAAAFDAEQDTKKTVEERLTAERDEAKARAEQTAQRYRVALIRSSFTTAAMGAGVPPDRIDAAFKLADLSAVEVDEEADKVKGITKAIESLPEWIKAAPYSGPAAIPQTPRGGSQTLTREQQIEQERELMRSSGRYRV
jgi:hypothetical protein